jgi:aldehyde dehydrogenase (NAD+)
MASQTIDRTPPAPMLHIGGKALGEGSGGIYHHIFPATGKVQAEVPMAGVAEVDAAVGAAQRVFEDWRRWPADRRQAVLLKLSQLVRDHADELARLAVLDTGTPISTAARIPARTTAWIDYYAGWIGKHEGQVTSQYGTSGTFGYTLAQPYGVIGIIITWNGPLTSLAMKVVPAIAAGNTVVVKSSEMTPFIPDAFARLCREAGIPDGVVSIMSGGVEAGRRLVRHPLVKKISFTGGPATARAILIDCAEQFKPAVLELGGKSANLVFPDADLERVCAHNTQQAIASMAGQGCAYPTRMLVERSIYPEVVDRMIANAAKIRVGDPFDPETQSGPVVNEAAVHRILGMVDRAKAGGGARLVAGGERFRAPLDDGYFIQPTIFVDVDPASEIAQHEVFGAVLSIIPFDSEEQAVRIANDTAYGLAAYIQTNDLRRAHRLAEELSAGAILINGAPNIEPMRPFGGFGISGIGKEGGREGFEEFLRVKSVAMT